MLATDLDTGISSWLRAWADSRDEVSEPRQRADLARIEKYILPHFKGRSFTRLQAEDVEKWLDVLAESRDSKPVGAATRTACLMILRQAIDLAIDRQGLQQTHTNPARLVKVQETKAIRQPDDSEILDEDQLQAILAHMDPIYQVLVLFAARTGAKWEECVGLRVADLHLRSASAAIGRFRVAESAGKFVEHEGAPEDVRMVRLDADLVAALKKHLNDTQDWRDEQTPWVFLTKRDHKRPLRPNFNVHVWRPALLKAGLDPRSVTFHSLRHSAAVRMIRQGSAPEDVMRQLGHRQEITTRRTYKRFFDEAQEAASAKRDAAINESYTVRALRATDATS